MQPDLAWGSSLGVVILWACNKMSWNNLVISFIALNLLQLPLVNDRWYWCCIWLKFSNSWGYQEQLLDVISKLLQNTAILSFFNYESHPLCQLLCFILFSDFFPAGCLKTSSSCPLATYWLDCVQANNNGASGRGGSGLFMSPCLRLVFPIASGPMRLTRP